MTLQIEGNLVPVAKSSLSSVAPGSRWEGKDGTPRLLTLSHRRRTIQATLSHVRADVATYLQTLFSELTDSASFETSVWTESGAPMSGTIGAVTGRAGVSYALYLATAQDFPRTLPLGPDRWSASGWHAVSSSGPWILKTEADPELELVNGRVRLASGYWSHVRITAANRPAGWAPPTVYAPSPLVVASGALLGGQFSIKPTMGSATILSDYARDIELTLEVVNKL